MRERSGRIGRRRLRHRRPGRDVPASSTRNGRVLKKVESGVLIDELFAEIDKWIADGMNRPKRLKMAKPARPSQWPRRR